ncbi:MAG: hypothetical protein AB7F96_16515 [Beijerinckiaceae bacterium]
MTCNPQTLDGPRAFWAWQIQECQRQNVTICGTVNANPLDMTPDPDGGMLKTYWLRSVIWSLLGTDAAIDQCDWNFSMPRLGAPGDAFRGTKSGNEIRVGLRGTVGAQLRAHGDRVAAQIAEFLQGQGISASVSVKIGFAGDNRYEIRFTVAQESFAYLARNTPEGFSFVWKNP